MKEIIQKIEALKFVVETDDNEYRIAYGKGRNSTIDKVLSILKEHKPVEAVGAGKFAEWCARYYTLHNCTLRWRTEFKPKWLSKKDTMDEPEYGYINKYGLSTEELYELFLKSK